MIERPATSVAPVPPGGPPATTLATGQLFAGRFELQEELGRGGMGVVYRAIDVKLQEDVAVKVLHPSIADDEKAVERLRSELKYARKISHRHVCRVHDTDECDGLPFITMQYVKGRPLDVILAGGKPLEWKIALRIARQVCEGMAEAHVFGVIHRDLKPANIMVDEDGDACIMDFGVARLLRAPGMTQVGLFVGTPLYMAPEQFSGGEVGQASDIYAFGAVLFEMLTGRAPFVADSLAAVALQHCQRAPPDPCALVPDLPPDVGRVVLRCLAKDPRERYASAEEVLADLARVGGDARSTAPQVTRLVVPRFLANPTDDESAGEAPLFVGREAELARLMADLDSAVAGKGRVTFVAGEAGAGKSALVKEFVRRAQERHGSVVVTFGSCSAYTGERDSYQPFRDVLGLLTGDIESRLNVGALTRHQASQLWEVVRPSIQAVLDAAPALIDSFVPSENLLARAAEFESLRDTWVARLRQLVRRRRGHASLSVEQRDLFEQYLQVLVDVAFKRPVLIVIEDLHWGDAGSINLLAHIGRRLEGQRILVVSTFRPGDVAFGRGGERHPLESVIAEQRLRQGGGEIDLGSKADAGFVDALLDAEPNELGESFRAQFRAITRGNPLFAVELLRSLRERGMLLRGNDGRWLASSTLDWDRLPARVEAVIQARLERLPHQLTELLSLAAVEGEEFTIQVVARVLGLDELAAVHLVSQELEKRQLLVRAVGVRSVDGRRVSTYAFGHILFQKYLYGRLDEVERAYLHERVGTALEELYGPRAADVAVALMRHFQAAGLPARELPYVEAASERALRGHDNDEVVRLLGRAAALTEGAAIAIEPHRRAGWHYMLGEANSGLGDLPMSRRHLESALALLGRPLPSSSPGLKWALLSQVGIQLAHLATGWKGQGRSPEKRNRAMALARAYERLAEVCYYSQEKPIALVASFAAVNCGERAGSSPELARGYANLGLGAGLVRRHPLARRYCGRAMRIARNVDSPSTVGYVGMVLATYQLGTGEFVQARASAEEAAGVFEQLGDWHRWETCLSLVGVTDALHRCDYARSLRAYGTLRRSAAAREDQQDLCLALEGEAFSLLRSGRAEEALGSLAGVDVDRLPDTLRYDKLSTLGLLALAYWRQGQTDAGTRAGLAALQLCARANMRFPSLKTYYCIAEVLLRHWETTLATDPVSAAEFEGPARATCRVLGEYASVFAIGQPAHLIWRGVSRWSSGQQRAAIADWRAAAATASRLGMDYEEATARAELGKHLSGTEREQHLRQSVAIFQRIGASYDAAAVERATG